MSEEGRLSKITKRGPLKKLGKKVLFGIVTGCIGYVLAGGVYATKTVYKVKTNYAVALETFNGKRIIVDKVGWHFRAPFFTRYEKEVSLMQKEMYLDGDISTHTIVSQDKISLLTSGLLTYRVVDPYKWAIDIQNAESLLQRDFNGMTKDVLQGSTEEEIIHKRDELKNKIFRRLKTKPINVGQEIENQTLEQKYGIHLVSFNITDAEYPANLMEASQRKKELELIADGESQLITRTYNAHSEGVKKFMEKTGLNREDVVNYLNQQRWAGAYEKSKDQKTYVINNSNEKLGLTIPTQEDKKQTQMLEDKIKELEKKIDALMIQKTGATGKTENGVTYDNNKTESNKQNKPKTK